MGQDNTWNMEECSEPISHLDYHFSPWARFEEPSRRYGHLQNIFLLQKSLLWHAGPPWQQAAGTPVVRGASLTCCLVKEGVARIYRGLSQAWGSLFYYKWDALQKGLVLDLCFEHCQSSDLAFCWPAGEMGCSRKAGGAGCHAPSPAHTSSSSPWGSDPAGGTSASSNSAGRCVVFGDERSRNTF